MAPVTDLTLWNVSPAYLEAVMGAAILGALCAFSLAWSDRGAGRVSRSVDAHQITRHLCSFEWPSGVELLGLQGLVPLVVGDVLESVGTGRPWPRIDLRGNYWVSTRRDALRARFGDKVQL